jgi:hypothetical protein
MLMPAVTKAHATQLGDGARCRADIACTSALSMAGRETRFDAVDMNGMMGK